VCWFINPIWQISPNSYVKQLTHLVLYPPNSPKVDCWSSHIQWKKPKICYVKKKDRTRGNLPDGRAAPRLCRASPPQRNPIPGVKSSGFSSFPPKVNENHHLDGVPHLDPLGSGQVKPMANPGWLFFSDCWLCSRVLYMLQILFKSNSANINQTDGLAHCSLARGHLMKEITSPTLSLCSCSKPSLVVYCKNRMVPIPNTSYIDPWFP